MADGVDCWVWIIHWTKFVIRTPLFIGLCTSLRITITLWLWCFVSQLQIISHVTGWRGISWGPFYYSSHQFCLLIHHHLCNISQMHIMLSQLRPTFCVLRYPVDCLVVGSWVCRHPCLTCQFMHHWSVRACHLLMVSHHQFPEMFLCHWKWTLIWKR